MRGEEGTRQEGIRDKKGRERGLVEEGKQGGRGE